MSEDAPEYSTKPHPADAAKMDELDFDIRQDPSFTPEYLEEHAPRDKALAWEMAPQHLPDRVKVMWWTYAIMHRAMIDLHDVSRSAEDDGKLPLKMPANQPEAVTLGQFNQMVVMNIMGKLMRMVFQAEDIGSGVALIGEVLAEELRAMGLNADVDVVAREPADLSEDKSKETTH